jgi:hypothetical protein
MLRCTKTLPALVVISAAALMAAVEYFWAYSNSGPTPEEFRVYAAFLNRKAADQHLRTNDFALARTTLELSDPQYESWILPELRHDKTYPSGEFAAFCGFCARNFVRKNLTAWYFEPGPHDALGISVVEASQTSPPKQYVAVSVTRVGFNLWHTRAVLSYSANCSDYAAVSDNSTDISGICVELGEAYLQKRNGIWRVDQYTDFLL